MAVAKTKKRPRANGKHPVDNEVWTPPIRPTRQIILDSGDPGFCSGILQTTPSRGRVRIEWHSAMRGLMVPPNWSAVTMVQRINEFFPTRYSVADAQNLAVRECLERDFEWLLMIEDDVCPPPDLYVRLAEYRKEGPPIVSGLYFTKGQPSEPLIYRGRGTGAYTDWKMGDKVWCDGVPTGCLLIHNAILREMWNDSTEYTIAGTGHRTREVFISPTRMWISPTGDVNTLTGTSDLEWCSRVKEGGYFERAGWGKFQEMEFPLLVDTGLFCRHVREDGMMFPPGC